MTRLRLVVSKYRVPESFILHGDCLEILAELKAEGVTVNSIVCDPPYGIGFMGKGWDAPEGIAFCPDVWRACLEVLEPGGYLLAFGGTRTYHRLACAIEDAGFVIQDTIAWIYGTGFPKNSTLLKPAFEPIVLAYKPGGKRDMQTNICRIACDDKTPFPVGRVRSDRVIDTGLHGKPQSEDSAPFGRWPANVCHDGSAEVIDLFPESKFIGHNPAHRRRGFWVDKPDQQLPESYTDSGSAARFFYCAKASKAERNGSKHPTVKPIALMRWLVRLVTIPGGIVLDPFAGTGTTGEAAYLEGLGSILIERESEYIEDIKARLSKYRDDSTHLAAHLRIFHDAGIKQVDSPSQD